MPGSCQHCGAQLALGAVACFRCGRLVARADDEAPTGASAVVDPTHLGTIAKAALLENQWRLVKVLGQGAVGQVWLAHDVTLDRPVAVKLMHAPLAKDPAQVSRFEREARLLAGVDHPALLAVLGVGRFGDQPFIVTHLLEGKTLAEHLHQRGGKLDPKEAARVFLPVCEGLSCLHAAGVVHRDLKPSNLFVGDDGQVTVLDLGSALEGGSELTRTAPLLLDSPYLSPEQRVGSAGLDAKSDVYALGCLLLEALTPEQAPLELAELARLAMAPAAADRPTASEFRAILARFGPPEPAPAPAIVPAAILPAAASPVPEAITAPSPSQTLVELTPLMDEPETGPAPTQLRAGLGSRRFTRSQLKYVVAAGLLAAALAMLFAPRPPPPPAPAADPLKKLAFLPPPSAPEAPQATADLLERKDDFAKREEERAAERRAPGRRAAPLLKKQTASYSGNRGMGELQVVVLLDGKEVTANLAVGKEALTQSPMYRPLRPQTYWITVEYRPFDISPFPVVVVADKTVRVEVELRPLM